MEDVFRTLLLRDGVNLCIEGDGSFVRRVFRLTEGLPEERPEPVTEQARAELTEYLSGTRERFSVPFLPEGTAFQMRIWRALGEIPHGETRSYAEIAKAAGVPGAFRAVGQAIGANRLLILIPCHRVLRRDGTLGGFSAGADLKQRLLRLEKTKIL